MADTDFTTPKKKAPQAFKKTTVKKTTKAAEGLGKHVSKKTDKGKMTLYYAKVTSAAVARKQNPNESKAGVLVVAVTKSAALSTVLEPVLVHVDKWDGGAVKNGHFKERVALCMKTCNPNTNEPIKSELVEWGIRIIKPYTIAVFNAPNSNCLKTLLSKVLRSARELGVEIASQPTEQEISDASDDVATICKLTHGERFVGVMIHGDAVPSMCPFLETFLPDDATDSYMLGTNDKKKFGYDRDDCNFCFPYDVDLTTIRKQLDVIHVLTDDGDDMSTSELLDAGSDAGSDVGEDGDKAADDDDDDDDDGDDEPATTFAGGFVPPADGA